MPHVDLSIIIVNWNGRHLLEECLSSIKNSKDPYIKQIILVDNGSKDDSADYVSENFSEVELIRSPVNLGFNRANNLAYKQAKGDFILMLNTDAFVSTDAISSTMNFLISNPQAGAVGARLIGRDGELQPSARSFPTPLRIFLSNINMDGKIPFVKKLDNLKASHNIIRECDWVVGCYLLTRKDLIDRMGFFLREDFFMYNDDNDLCLRIKRNGYKVYFYPVDVIHLGGASASKSEKLSKKGSQIEKYQIDSQMIYFRKNYWLGTVLTNYTLWLLFDLMRLVKYTFKPRSRENIQYISSHISIMTRTLLKTKFGSRSLYTE